MSATRNIQATMRWAQGFIKYLPLLVGSQDPTITIANIVLQTILGPPFAWRWNRGQGSPISLTTAAQDYAQAISDFGFIEKAWIASGSSIMEMMGVEQVLAATTETSRPTSIAAQLDDNAGNITFRFMPKPDTNYTATVVYQRKAPIITSICNTWSPVPDEMQYIYENGFLALAAVYANDGRFPIFNQRFIAHILGAQDGLDATQKNIFLGNWMEVAKQLQRGSMSAEQAAQARMA